MRAQARTIVQIAALLTSGAAVSGRADTEPRAKGTSGGAPPRDAHEAVPWDAHVPSIEECLRVYEAGPDANTAAMLAAVGPLEGMRVLDFSCGAGVTSCFLAQRGATVTALDISPASIERARQLARRLGFSLELIAGELTRSTFPPRSFDAVIGRYALHHVDLTRIAPLLGELLVAEGRGAFVETMALNPLLTLARTHLAGRLGAAGYGSEHEQPLDRDDLATLARTFAKVEVLTAQMSFLRIFDRNVLRYRAPRLSESLGRIDDRLLARGYGSLSYHQVLKVSKSARA